METLFDWEMLQITLWASLVGFVWIMFVDDRDV